MRCGLARARIMKLFLNWSIALKFKVIYVVMIFLCIIGSIVLIRMYYIYETQQTVMEYASQTLQSTAQNAERTIEGIAKASTYLLGDPDVQNYLVTESNHSEYPILAGNLRNFLYLSLEFIPTAASIMVIRESGDYECAGRYTLPIPKLKTPQDAQWYQEVVTRNGSPIYTVNGGGYLIEEETNYLTLIRQINSTEDVRPLGYLLINIPVENLFTLQTGASENYLDLCVYAGNSVLYPFAEPALNEYFAKQSPSAMEGTTVLTAKKTPYTLNSVKSASYGLTYFGATQEVGNLQDDGPFILVCVSILAISAMITVIVSICTRAFVTAPLSRLAVSMQKTREGNFIPANVTENHDEIGQLQDTYNEMVQKIQELLHTKVMEQKQLRKAELKILQEQIKPHFLYNSLNGISYLIASRQNETAQSMLLALSDYYRESLSKGSDVIPLSVELNITRNYLTLQKMRFPDLIEEYYDIQKETLDILIPRLTLQPLVENALYHGILPTGDCGSIEIRAYLEGELLKIQIKDDGMGMDAQRLNEVLSGTTADNQTSFGLRGTVERLQNFYDKKDIYSIISAPGEGTEILFSIPYTRRGEEMS